MAAFGGQLAEPVGLQPDQEPKVPLKRSPERSYEPERDIYARYGWISPEGVFWSCKFHVHDAVARHFRPDAVNATIALESDGWLKVSWDNDRVRLVIYRSPTIAQLDRVEEWCAINRIGEQEIEVRPCQ